MKEKCMRQVMVCFALVAGLVSAAAAAKVEIRTQRDKSFSFSNLHTWDWHPDGAGDVKMMSTSFDDPKQVKEQLDPVITQAVEKELATRGLNRTPGGKTDLLVNYYLLVMPATSSTEMGHFLPSVAEYGLPPIKQATNYMRAFERGSLVIDVVAPALKTVVWRGIAQTEVNRELSDQERSARINKAVQDIIKKLPAK
jgi:hypothetical protein